MTRQPTPVLSAAEFDTVTRFDTTPEHPVDSWVEKYGGPFDQAVAVERGELLPGPPPVDDFEANVANLHQYGQPIEDCLDGLEDIARALNVALVDAKHLPFEYLVAIHSRTQLVRDAIQTSEAGLVDLIWKAKGDAYGDVEIPGVGVVSIRRTRNRSAWDHEALAGAVLDKHMEKVEGELPDPEDVKRWILDAVGVGYWRKGALSELGIDVDDYCASSPGSKRIDYQRPSGVNPLLDTRTPSGDSPSP